MSKPIINPTSNQFKSVDLTSLQQGISDLKVAFNQSIQDLKRGFDVARIMQEEFKRAVLEIEQQVFQPLRTLFYEIKVEYQRFMEENREAILDAFEYILSKEFQNDWRASTILYFSEKAYKDGDRTELDYIFQHVGLYTNQINERLKAYGIEMTEKQVEEKILIAFYFTVVNKPLEAFKKSDIEPIKEIRRVALNKTIDVSKRDYVRDNPWFYNKFYPTKKRGDYVINIDACLNAGQADNSMNFLISIEIMTAIQNGYFTEKEQVFIDHLIEGTFVSAKSIINNSNGKLSYYHWQQAQKKITKLVNQYNYN